MGGGLGATSLCVKEGEVLLKDSLYKILLPKLLKNVCGARIPRSGEKGEKVNCYSVALDKDNSPFFIATSYKNNILSGLKWNGNQYEEEFSLKVSEISDYKFRVTHYYGLADIYYKSIYDLTWNYYTRMVYIKINSIRLLSSFSQYFFNKKRLVTKKRMELLQFMLDIHLDGEGGPIHLIDLMTKLYSFRWVLHPSADDQENKLRIYLDSLVESGEIKNNNGNYLITGKAISTIENYEKDEQRHNESVKLQRRLVWLTLILVLVGLIQSGLIKLPTLLDISGK